MTAVTEATENRGHRGQPSRRGQKDTEGLAEGTVFRTVNMEEEQSVAPLEPVVLRGARSPRKVRDAMSSDLAVPDADRRVLSCGQF